MKSDSANPSGDAVETIFNAALKFGRAERAAFLAGACGENGQLRQRVEALLRAQDEAEGFLPDSPQARPTALQRPVTEAAGDKIGRYKLLQKIGEGGCGVVHMAEQEEPVRRRVALKVIKLGMDTKSVIARFEAERQALAMMDHPNIAKVLDAGATETGRPYFVMELVRGIKITEYCDQNNLSTRDRLDLFVKVCQAIQHAHQKGIIHRDIKPSNILVTLHDGVPVPKVIDFGIAKATEGRLTDQTLFTAFEQFIGTPAYMSPEQAEMSGLDIDTRSDIYSLGVLLYELLTGKTPFDANELMSLGIDAMRRTIREQEPVRPSTRLTQELASVAASRESAADSKDDDSGALTRRRYNRTRELIDLLRGDLDWIVMKALEKDRTRRYETANGFATDIGRFLTNEPVVARPPSAVYRFQKLVRRNKLAFSAASAIALVLLLGIVVSTWQAARAIRARNEANASEQRAQQARTNESVERKRAQAEAERANQNAKENREQLLRLTVANGARLQEEGDPTGSLLWFAKSLSIAQGDPTQEHLHRLRFTSALRNCPKLLHVLVHDGGVNYAEFSPDGRRIVTASSDHTARIWDAVTGDPVTPPLQHTNEVVYASFSPDSHWVVTAGCSLANDYARVWSADTGEALTPRLNHDSGVAHATFSPDSLRLVTASWDKTAQVWDSATGVRVTPPLKHDGLVFHASFSPDGHRIATCGKDGARVWNADTGELFLTLLYQSEVDHASFSPDGRRILTAGTDGACVWDAATGQKLVSTLKHDAGVIAAFFSSDGRWIVTGSLDQTARVWDAGTGKPVSPPLRSHYILGNPYHIPSFSSDGNWVVTGGSDHSAQIWNPLTGEPVGQPLNHNGPIAHASFSPDNRLLLTASHDGTARLWDVSEEVLQTLPQKSAGIVNQVSHSPDGRHVVITSGGGLVHILDTVTERPVGQPLRHAKTVTQTAFSPDGRCIATASEDRTARVWDATTGQALTGPLQHSDAVEFAYFSPDSQRLVTAGYDQVVRLWDVRTGSPVCPPVKYGSFVEHASFSPDSQRIVASCADGTARVCDAATGQPLMQPLKHLQGVTHSSFSPDGRLIVTTSYDRTARLWDAATGEPLIAPLKHDHPVLYAAFDGDGYQLFTFTQDRESRWDLSLDTRSVDNLRLVAQILAGREIDHTGSLLNLKAATFRTVMQQWRLKDQGDLIRRGTMAESVQGNSKVVAAFRFTKDVRGRDSSREPFLVDLSAHYNATLTENREGGGDLASLPTGRQTLAGTDFDLRGIVQLAGTALIAISRTNFPERIVDVKLGRKCQLLHFLHAEAQAANRRWVGSYRLHYRNGQTWEIPIICGQDVRNWWTIPNEPLEAKRSVVAWTGRNAQNPLRLYKTTWENPLPNVEVENMDFVSAMTWPAPFLIAMTLE